MTGLKYPLSEAALAYTRNQIDNLAAVNATTSHDTTAKALGHAVATCQMLIAHIDSLDNAGGISALEAQADHLADKNRALATEVARIRDQRDNTIQDLAKTRTVMNAIIAEGHARDVWEADPDNPAKQAAFDHAVIARKRLFAEYRVQLRAGAVK